MTYEAVWKVLSDMVTEFRKKGKQIPANIMQDLRSARTLIQVAKADKTCEGTVIPKIEQYLSNVEFFLFSEAQTIGEEFFKEWIEKLTKAREKAIEEAEAEAGSSVSHFVPGVPREEQWIRIKASAETPEEVIRRIAEEENLSCKRQPDGYFLISGDKERIKAFIRKMAKKHE